MNQGGEPKAWHEAEARAYGRMMKDEKGLTVKRALHLVSEALVEAGIEKSEAEAESQWILAAVLGMKRFEVFLHGGSVLAPSKKERLDEIVRRRQRREPLAHILGAVDFRGHHIRVTPDVLIPRPETEVLVDAALEILGREEGPKLMLEPCTGSGCISIALGAEGGEGLRIVALDISERALALAQENARAAGVEEKIRFLRADIMALPLREPGPFGMIISNPPYVRSSDMAGLAPEVREYEPAIALDGGTSGMDCIRRLVEVAPRLLRPGGHLLLEIGAGQAEEVSALACAAGALEDIVIKKDLSGMERIFSARKKASSGQ